MRNVVLTVTALVAGAMILKSCGEPYSGAAETVEEFMEEVMEGDGMDAVQYLHPSYRDELAKNLRLPVQFTELRPTELLACALSTMGAGIDDVDIKKVKLAGEDVAKVVVSVEDKEGLEKLFSFLVVKEGDRWYIAKIENYAPKVSS
ncbi:MAG: DUF4878 domain-containing protein [Aquificae bacterium]|nr:DUF4878 domain-containing protein [Aquificota bacterium]